MGAGRGRSRRALASTGASELGRKSPGRAPGVAALRAEIIDAMDRVVADTGDIAGGCPTRAIVKVGHGLETRVVAQHLRAMEKDGIVVSCREGGRKHTWWKLELRDQAANQEFDFGYLRVPAHRHQNGGGWVADSAKVHDEAYVGPNAIVSGAAVVGARVVVAEGTHVSGYARVLGSATVRGTAEVGEKAKITGAAVIGNQAVVDGNAEVGGEARILSRARVTGSSAVCDEAHATGHAVIDDNAVVADNALVGGEARVGGSARVAGSAKISDNAKITGNAVVDGDVEVLGYAEITGDAHLRLGVYSGDEVVDSARTRGAGKMRRLDDSDLLPLAF